MLSIIFENIFRKKKEELSQPTSSPETIEQFKKFDTKLTEIQLSIEDLQDTLHNQEDDLEHKDEQYNKENKLLLEALLTAVDMLEDFCVFANETDNASLKVQADMMYQTLQKKCAGAGLVRIPTENTKPDAKYDKTIDGETSDNIPKGHIMQTIRSGYLYKDQIIRKSEVIVSKGN